MTYIIGLTGKPGTGKTYLAKLLSRLGLKGWNADESSSKHFVSGPVQELLKKKYAEFFNQNQLDKNQFFIHLWKKPMALGSLEAILHPLIEEDLKTFLYENRHEKILWLEVPLLFEAHWEHYCDCILVTHCREDIAHQRLCLRGWNMDRIKALDQRYPALEQYIQSGLPTVDTNGSKYETWQQLRKRIER